MKFSFVTYIKRIKVVKNFEGSSLYMYDKSNKDVCFINFLSNFCRFLIHIPVTQMHFCGSTFIWPVPFPEHKTFRKTQ